MEDVLHGKQLRKRIMNIVINEDCTKALPKLLEQNKGAIIVSDPPFNVGYHYGTYKDNIPESEYWEWMGMIFSQAPSVIVHYPESINRLSIELGEAPNKVVSWVYNSNTAKQHRDIAFYGVTPDFTKVRQPYKNPNDKRIRERIRRGHKGGRLYDWWNVNQVKNVSKDKTVHPCQMPLKVMENIIGILPEATIIDPFCGSGTTGVACKVLGRDFIGIEIDEQYARTARERIEGYTVQDKLSGIG